MRSVLLALGGALALCGAAPGVAAASWSAPYLVSEVGGQQTIGENSQNDGSTQPDLSADGRYIVFSTTARNLVDVPDPDAAFFRRGGIVRKDLDSGVIELVAPGSQYELLRPFIRSVDGAANPSVSATGRFVSFETLDKLVPQDTNGSRDVYVRDMNVPATAPGAYELASALDGTDVAPTYVFTGNNSARVGAETGRAGASISDDGDTVLFYVGAASNLPGPVSSPAQQLLLRRRSSRRTIAVNTVRDETTGEMTETPAGGAENRGSAEGGVAAVLSGDGTTVVWSSGPAAAEEQLPRVTGEGEVNALLWRRVGAPAPGATRRVTGAVDIDDPACRPDVGIGTLSGPVASPCEGPLAVYNAALPLLANAGQLSVSADGRTVAFATSWPLRSQQPQPRADLPDLLVADMRDGLSRKQGFREITRSEPVTTGGLGEIALSADGGTLAIVASDLRLRLSPPDLIGAPATDVTAQQLYALDLRANTMEVATRGVNGASPNDPGSPWSPAVTPDGRRIVFATRSTNLIAADGNEVADVFGVDRVESNVPLAAQSIPAAPRAQVLQPLRRLRVTTTSLRDGRVRVTVTTPSRGSLAVTAKGPVGKGRKRAVRTVAASKRRVSRAGIFRVTLRLRPALRGAVPRAGLAVSVRVGFKPSTGRTGLTRTVAAKFTRPKGAKR